MTCLYPGAALTAALVKKILRWSRCEREPEACSGQLACWPSGELVKQQT